MNSIEWYTKDQILKDKDREIEHFISNQIYSLIPELKQSVTKREDIQGKLQTALGEITKNYLKHLDEWNKKEQPFWINHNVLKKQIEQLETFRANNL